MATPLSGSTPYCTNQQFLDRYDARTVGDLLSDNNVRAVNLSSSALLTELLAEASGWVEAACLKSDHYLPSDLASLTGNSAGMLAGLVAGLAMFMIWDRRPTRLASVELPTRAKLALDQLDQLEKGVRIFGFAEAAAAGNLSPVFQDIDDINTLNLSSNQARRLFGDRARDYVPGQ
jgi:hypothetical protein